MSGLSAFSRFISRLMEYESEIDEIFQALVKTMCELLPDFGHTYALNGKIMKAYASSFNKKDKVKAEDLTKMLLVLQRHILRRMEQRKP